MDRETLENYITLILNREVAHLKLAKYTWFVNYNNNKKAQIEYENAQALIDVFSNLTENTLKEEFVTILCREIWNRQEDYQSLGKRNPVSTPTIVFSGTSAIAFYTLLQLGFVDEAIQAYQYRVINFNCYLVFSILQDIFREEYNYFTIKQLNELTKNFSLIAANDENLASIATRLQDFITDNGFKILQNEIKGVNIEINRDKETVIKKINILGLNKEYELFLNSLDEYLNSNENIVASGMIANFRSFWEKLIIDMARKLSIRISIDIPKDKGTPISYSRLFLKTYLGLSDADNSLISKYVEIMHSEGGHAFTSTKEYFRLTRNIGIEILLLLLSKIENAKGKS